MVLRPHRGEDLERVSRELGLTTAELSERRDTFLEGGESGLTPRPARVSVEVDRLQSKIGEQALEIELLREKSARMEQNRPLALRLVGHAARRETRLEALEPIRQGVRRSFGVFGKNVADGLTLRHDHGSQFLSEDFQREIAFLGIKDSPSYVREPQGNGIAERFVRILKENLLWVRAFQTVEDLRQWLQAFKETCNTRWRVGRHGYRTPEQHREKLLSALGKAA